MQAESPRRRAPGRRRSGNALRLTREQAEREASREAVATQRQNLTGEVGKLTATLETDRVEEDNADELLATLNEQTRALVARRDACRLRAIALEVEVSRLNEKREGLTRSLGADIAALRRRGAADRAEAAAARAGALSGEDAAAERERLTLLRAKRAGNLAQRRKSIRSGAIDGRAAGAEFRDQQRHQRGGEAARRRHPESARDRTAPGPPGSADDAGDRAAARRIQHQQRRGAGATGKHDDRSKHRDGGGPTAARTARHGAGQYRARWESTSA